MRQCPKCERWTLEYDEYFLRYRCFNPDCGWIPPSSTERQLRLLEGSGEPKLLLNKSIPQLGLHLTAHYDNVNDALLFDFGLGEASFDLPESNGRMIWKISRLSGSVCGFTIIGARQFGVGQVKVNFDARKETIEQSLRGVPTAIINGRPTRVLIERVEVTAHTKQPNMTSDGRITEAVNEAFREFEALEVSR